jgi:hypothetical protein
MGVFMKTFLFIALLSLSNLASAGTTATCQLSVTSSDIFSSKVTLHYDSVDQNKLTEITVQEIVRGQPTGDAKTFALTLINDYQKGQTYTVDLGERPYLGIVDNFIGKSSVYVNLVNGPTGSCQL